MNPFTVEVILKEREWELMENTRWRSRQPASHNGDSLPGLWPRIQIELGEMLIRLGRKIKDRHARPVELNCISCSK